MNTRRIVPARFSGTLAVPTSKSLTHRALIIAAFSAAQHGRSVKVYSPLQSDDTALTLRALQALGFETHRAGVAVESLNSSFSSEMDTQMVEFTGTRKSLKEPVYINIHHSGTSARLLSAVAAAQPFEPCEGMWIEIDGSARMRERPMRELIAPLEQLGAKLRSAQGFLPIRITAPITQAGEVEVDASKSSQFLSALLLIAPLLHGTMRISVRGDIASKSYADMTLAQMRHAGIEIEEQIVEYEQQREERSQTNGFRQLYSIQGGQSYTLTEYAVEGDYSAASYPLAAALITGGEVVVPNLVRNSTQGDKAVVDILHNFGATVEWLQNEGGVRLRRGGVHLCGVDEDMNTCPDIVPTLAVVAMFAESRSRFRNIDHLRYKESDRVAAVIENIKRLGGRAFTEGSALIVEPGGGNSLHGASIPTFDDHRMAMSFALAGLRIPDVVIEQPECVAKSYPHFWRDFEALSHAI